MAPKEPTLADGEAFVPKRSREKAAELLALAAAAGFAAGVVKTTSHGYIVPAAILDTEEGEAVQFDPLSATITDVRDYLAGADDTERERVLAVETASEKPRKGVLELAEAPEGAK